MNDRITPQLFEAKLPGPDGERYVTVFRHGALELEFYKPLGQDPQTPHTRDEMYFVISGSGWFVRDGVRKPVGAGEVLYVPAGVEHRFEEFSEDFSTWAVFIG